MAIQTDITIEHLGKDLLFPNAFIEVIRYEGNVSSCIIVVQIKTSATGSAIDERKYLIQHDASVPLLSQAYLHLKTLPEFLNATDC